jgi:hypothetical protein
MSKDEKRKHMEEAEAIRALCGETINSNEIELVSKLTLFFFLNITCKQ